MNKEKYKKMTEKIVPEENKIKNGIIAFIVGGLVGLLGQFIVFILENNFEFSSKDSSAIMIVILIFIASLCTALGFFDNLVAKAKMGLIIPITGFAHAMTSSMIDYKREGFVTGIGTNAFKLTGTVILYGVVSAYVFGLIRFVFFGG